MSHSLLNNNSQHAAIQASWFVFLRVFVGLWWLYEVTLAKYWKVGLFGFLGMDVNCEWVCAEAGTKLAELATRALDSGVWSWYATIIETVILPYSEIWSYLVVALQILLGVTMVLGLFTRIMSFAGIGLVFSITLLGFAHTPPFLLVGHLIIIATNAGLHWGLDGWLMNKLDGVEGELAHQLRFRITLGFEQISLYVWRLFAYSIFVTAVIFLLQTASMPSTRMQLVSLELSVILGLLAWGVYAYASKLAEPVTAIILLLRTFVGYKLVWTIWASPILKATGMPGFANPIELGDLLALMINSHWQPIASLIQAIVLPNIGLWSLLFGLSQAVLGMMMVLGWKTPQVNRIVVGLLSVYLLLGFTRYVPYLLGYAILAMVLQSIKYASINSDFDGEESLRVCIFSRVQAHILIALWVVASYLALTLGIEVSGYTTAVGATVFSAVAIIVFSLAVTALVQSQSNLFQAWFKQVGEEQPQAIN